MDLHHLDKDSLPPLLLEAVLQETRSDLLLLPVHQDLVLLYLLPVPQISLDLPQPARIEQFLLHSQMARFLLSQTLLLSSNRCRPLLLQHRLNKVKSKRLLLKPVSPLLLLLDPFKVKVAQSHRNLGL